MRFLRSFIVISPSKRPCSSTIGSFSTLLVLKIFSASSKVQPFGAVIKGILVITFSTKFEKSLSNLKSRLVSMPISFLSSSTTGTPEILYSAMISKASATLALGLTKIGSIITPLSLFFTLFTSLTCEAISIFL